MTINTPSNRHQQDPNALTLVIVDDQHRSSGYGGKTLGQRMNLIIIDALRIRRIIIMYSNTRIVPINNLEVFVHTTLGHFYELIELCLHVHIVRKRIRASIYPSSSKTGESGCQSPSSR